MCYFLQYSVAYYLMWMDQEDTLQDENFKLALFMQYLTSFCVFLWNRCPRWLLHCWHRNSTFVIPGLLLLILAICADCSYPLKAGHPQ